MDLLEMTFKQWFLITTFTLGLCTYPIILIMVCTWLENEIRWRKKTGTKKTSQKRK